MKIGFVGLGKLGLPCAVAMALRGHDVMGYDRVARNMSRAPRAYRETGPDGVSDFNSVLSYSSLRFGSMRDVAAHGEVIFVGVQTPHLPEFEGIDRIPKARADFDYTYLKRAVRELSEVITCERIVVIISTVLPGTIRREIMPLLPDGVRLVYNPYFIAMGTTMHDFLNPEFVLLGGNDSQALARVGKLYDTLVSAPVHTTSIENAELIKVLYNTFIGMKIAFGNIVMEVCEKTPGTSSDDVVTCLARAGQRLISSRYLSGGMGDGGGCHPRDNVAMSWYARKLGLSFDLFENIMLARERGTEWLANLMESYDLPKTILGYAYKENTNITTGSAAILLRNILRERGVSVAMYDPYIDANDEHIAKHSPRVYLIGARPPQFQSYPFIAGSVVIDPWRYLTISDPSITYRPVGQRPREHAVEMPLAAVARERMEHFSAPTPSITLSAV
jgi:UDPglucose 6-dehydrogenase